MIKKAFKKLSKANVQISRAQWIEEAMSAEKSNSLKCCEAIIKESIKLDIYTTSMEQKEADKEIRRICIEDALACKQKGQTHTAYSILRECLTLYPNKKKLWNQLIDLTSENENDQKVAEILKEAVEKANNNIILILKYAKHIWKKLDNPTLAKEMLEIEFTKNPNSEHLCLAL
jgi:pre-mRNA-processing factor 6